MRKRITSLQEDAALEPAWLALGELADVDLTSEDPAAPIEGAFDCHAPAAWRAGAPGVQTIRLQFRQPVRIRWIRLTFEETARSRTQEFVLRWRSHGDRDREIVRQQFTFAPPGTVREREDFHVDLEQATALELSIVPDVSGGDARATLNQLCLA